ncbi:MAG: hypothetical protein L0271_15920 [Gemmatimonadetes bacterium]|nr:hypothetical protein [Gemmatimonadota bacterium]
MLTNVLGVRLMVLMGRTLPVPPSLDVTNALMDVEVRNDTGANGDGFQLTFALGKDQVVEYGLLTTGALEPFSRVILAVLFGVVPEVLIDGVITHHEITPSDDPGRSTLMVHGRDVSLMLDLEEKDASYPNQPDFLIVTSILARYAQYGIVPMPMPTSDIPIMLQRIPRQSETDLRFIQRLAQRNGYVFYIEPLTFGVNTAYFGPENRLSLPQPALSQNLGEATNVRSLRFSLDALAPVSTSGTLLEPITKAKIPVPSLPSLKVPPLALKPTPAKRSVRMRQTANQGPGQAMAAALAGVSNAPDAVTAQGELDGVRYGHALRARKLVGVRGAGLSYDGFFYVRSVTHRITRGSYTQSFTLSREGTMTLVPAVVP